VKKKNTLREKLATFQDTWENRYSRMNKWKADGKQIFGYAYSDVPIEILHAAGILPIQFTESGNDTHHSMGTTESASYFCDYSQSVIGQALAGVYSAFDGVVFAHSCETMRMIASVWEIAVSSKFFRFIPTALKRNQINRTFLTEEYNALKKAIENYTGREITPGNLTESIKTYNKNRKMVRDLYKLKFENRILLSASELNSILKPAWVIPVEMHNEMLTDLFDEVDEMKYANKESHVNVMLSGFSPEQYFTPRLNIADIIEQELGANIVVDDFACGHRYNWLQIDKNADPISALVDYYLGRAPVSFRQTAEQEGNRIQKLARDCSAQGAILLVPKFCTDYLYQLPYIESVLEENGIKVLRIETDEQMPEGQLRTRLGAFIEMIRTV